MRELTRADEQRRIFGETVMILQKFAEQASVRRAAQVLKKARTNFFRVFKQSLHPWRKIFLEACGHERALLLPSFLELAEDVGFADHLTFEARGDGKEEGIGVDTAKNFVL